MREKAKRRHLYWIPFGGNNSTHLGGNASLLTYSNHENFDPNDATMFKDGVLIDFGSTSFGHTASKDYTIPDLDFLFPEKNSDEETPLKAIILTHYHDDHIKGLADLIVRGRKTPPIIATPLTLEALKHYLSFCGVKSPDIELIPAVDKKPIQLGDWLFTAFPVSHSTAECKGFVFEIGDKRAVHMGDFKLDQNVILGPKADLDYLDRLGEKGVDFLMLDSTKADQDAPYAMDDARMLKDLEALFEEQDNKRVIFAIYGSYLEMVAASIVAAGRHGRSVIVSSQNLKQNIKAFEAVHGDFANYLFKKSGIYVKILDDEDPKARQEPPLKTLVISDGNFKDPDNFFVKSMKSGSIRTNCPVLRENDKIFLSSSVYHMNGDYFKTFKERFSWKSFHLYGPDKAPLSARGHGPWPDMADVIKRLNPGLVAPTFGYDRMLKAAESKIKSRLNKRAVLVQNGEMIDTQTGDVVAYKRPQWAGIKYKWDSARSVLGRVRLTHQPGPDKRPAQKRPNRGHKPKIA